MACKKKKNAVTTKENTLAPPLPLWDPRSPGLTRTPVAVATEKGGSKGGFIDPRSPAVSRTPLLALAHANFQPQDKRVGALRFA
mmetsp:Transcript_13635/g.21608  ORF Transcript_13635/g.21608 Transcript_13635/m.21608 type:complete len:84 (+) Transcript_13635:166-417(+)